MPEGWFWQLGVAAGNSRIKMLHLAVATIESTRVFDPTYMRLTSLGKVEEGKILTKLPRLESTTNVILGVVAKA